MKILITLLLIACLLSCNAQKDKAVMPVPHVHPYKDSTFYEVECDTTYGTISYTVGYTGTVKGNGMLVHCEYWKWTVDALLYHDTTDAIGSKLYIVGKDTFHVYAPAGIADLVNETTKAYIYFSASMGYKQVNAAYTFTPGTAPITF